MTKRDTDHPNKDAAIRSPDDVQYYLSTFWPPTPYIALLATRETPSTHNQLTSSFRPGNQNGFRFSLFVCGYLYPEPCGP